MTEVDEYLKQFLNVYWLRPETALWRTIDCVKLSEIKFEKPVIDIGCGDGIFSFIKAGGKFGLGFDMYLSVKDLNNFFENVDIYDTFSDNDMVYNIIKKPTHRIDVGLDRKQQLLNKADFIQVYDKLIQHDANNKLPLEDESFNTIFSNIVYWLDNVDKTLNEFARIVTDEGKIILMLPDKSFKDSFIYNHYLQDKSIWAKLLDRGRYGQLKKCYSFDEWNTFFKKGIRYFPDQFPCRLC